MNNENSLVFLEPKIRESLEKGNLAEFETHGYSMIPLLHDGGDKVRLKKSTEKLKKGDVALCVTDDGRYVLHRVVGFRDEGYILQGDNCISCEFCRNDTDVIGVAVGFIRNGRLISTDSFSYKVYIRLRKPLLKIWKIFWKFADRYFSKKQNR